MGENPEYTYLNMAKWSFSGRLMNDAAADLIAEKPANGPEECFEMQYQLAMLEADKNKR